jgi:hypothetical protein
LHQVRRDLQQISQSGVPIVNKRAARHMRKWGCDKVYGLLARTLASLLGASLDRWRWWLRRLKADERREAYRKYQAVQTQSAAAHRTLLPPVASRCLFVFLLPLLPLLLLLVLLPRPTWRRF